MKRGYLDRSFYRPRYPGAVKITHKELPIEVWAYDLNRKFSSGKEVTRYGLVIFGDKRSKPDVDLIFPTADVRAERYDGYVESYKSGLALKEKLAAERKKPHGLKVGDLMKCSWGYDQTNVDFYEVIKLNGKTMVTIEKIGSKTVRTERGADYVSPDPSVRTGKTLRRKVSPSSNSVSIESYSAAYPTTLDSEHYETAMGWGH